jgi:hypothetical protein
MKKASTVAMLALEEKEVSMMVIAATCEEPVPILFNNEMAIFSESKYTNLFFHQSLSNDLFRSGSGSYQHDLIGYY